MIILKWGKKGGNPLFSPFLKKKISKTNKKKKIKKKKKRGGRPPPLFSPHFLKENMLQILVK